jgi:tetratricopeptide (TPR) repeat protein
MDPNNPIVKLCAAGIAAEAEGRAEDAKALFEQAWAESRDDFEACIAAHYLARHQPTLAADRADRVADERVRDFYASLYLNLGHSLEKLGRAAEACELYERAAERAEEMPDSPYTRLVRMGIAAGQARACPSGAARDGDTTTRLH